LTFLPAGAVGTNLALDQSLEWFGTVRGRAGVLVTPQVLLYGTGGLAYGSIKSTGALAGFTPGVLRSLPSARTAIRASAGRSVPASRA
jgi:outer membrane immunogenic protein